MMKHRRACVCQVDRKGEKVVLTFTKSHVVNKSYSTERPLRAVTVNEKI